MTTPFWVLRDWWGRWAIDRAGVQAGEYSLTQLKDMVLSEELNPHTWIRHRLTGRYSLVGETLFQHGVVDASLFELWFPARFQHRTAA